MITVEEAYETVMRKCSRAVVESVELAKAQGRIIAENIYADRDFPPFDRVTMDGIAISYQVFASNLRVFPIQEVVAAGSPTRDLNSPKDCMEVMTGAMLPGNTDTVIRYEDLTIEDGIACIDIETIKEGQNVHLRGSDRPKASILMTSGKMINAPELGVLATCGRSKVEVFRLPKVAIISSGDELVEVALVPEPHQIRRSNNHSIAGALATLNVPSTAFHLLDNAEEIKEALSVILDDYDVLVLSGGVSMGKFDFIPEALEALGVKKHFHKVRQRPGKPFWFGSTEDGKTVFALPGNPVSSFMCTNKYVLPWMRKHLGLESPNYFAVLDSDINFNPDLNYFAQVSLRYMRDGRTMADPVEGNGSGDLANLTDAHAFMELPRGKNKFEKGECYPILKFNI